MQPHEYFHYFPGNAAEKPLFAESLSRNNLFPEK